MVRKFSLGVIAALLISALIILACSDPSGLHSTVTLYPENPDSEPYDSDDPYEFLDGENYMVYANVENTIYRFAIDDSSVDGYEVVAENIDSRNPQFSVSDDNEYIAFTRSIDEEGNSGYFLVVKNLSTGEETYINKDTSTQSLYREFLITGNDYLVFSDNGVLESWAFNSLDLINSGSKDPVYINSNKNTQICNHQINLGADGLLTYIEQDPNDNDALAYVHALSFDGTSSNTPLTATIKYTNKSFEESVYPITFENGMMSNVYPEEGSDKVDSFFDLSSGGSSYNTITCSKTNTEVEFTKIYQTPSGTWNFLFGEDSVYWFKTENRPTAAGEYAVSGRDFVSNIEWIKATPDDKYVLMQDTHGIWVYQENDGDFNQLYCRYEWLNQENEVLWLEVTEDND